MTLYEIDAAIMACADPETGEIIDHDALDKLNMERGQKIRNIALWIKDLKSESEALKAEKLEFAKRQQVAENKMESLKKYLSATLGGKKIKETEFTISYRKSQAVEITDIEALPKGYLIIQDPVPDKKMMAENMKKGVEIPGAQMVEHESIIIR
jgi:hypothetical protein